MEQLYIKNMVCARCIKVVKEEILALGLTPSEVELGIVSFQEKISVNQKLLIQKALEKNGFEILDDKNARLIEKVKSLLLENVYQHITRKEKLSEWLRASVGVEYSYLSHLFSAMEGTSIEKYLINLKIERAKELLIYDELNNSEIAYQLGYSSLQHFSTQFKKATGLTPTDFRKIRPLHHRQSLS